MVGGMEKTFMDLEDLNKVNKINSFYLNILSGSYFTFNKNGGNELIYEY